MHDMTVELSWLPPANAQQLHDIDTAIGEFAEIAGVDRKDIEIGTAAYDDDYAAASFTFKAAGN